MPMQCNCLAIYFYLCYDECSCCIGHPMLTVYVIGYCGDGILGM